MKLVNLRIYRIYRNKPISVAMLLSVDIKNATGYTHISRLLIPKSDRPLDRTLDFSLSISPHRFSIVLAERMVITSVLHNAYE